MCLNKHYEKPYCKLMENKKVKYYDKVSPLSHFYDFGLTPDDIKVSIIDSFAPYFSNQENLKKYAVSDLTSNWLAYLSVYKEYPDSLRFLDNILDIFNGAKEKNEKLTIESYAQWMPETTQSVSRFWSLHNNQMKLHKLCIEDFVEESLHMIGQTIEGLSKSFFKMLLQLNKIKRNKQYDITEIKQKDLGVVIDELINTTELTELLILQPHDIRLNQWRNIAYHHNSRIINNEIICGFNKSGNVFEFKLTRQELSEILKRILLIFKLVRISETIFGFDNLENVQSEVNKYYKTLINIRDDGKLLDFYSGIESQGFRIVELKTSDRKSMLVLKDLEPYGDFIKRAIHSSQFLYNFWLYTESEYLQVEYQLFNGEKFFTSEIDNKGFIDSSEKSTLSKMLKNVKFTPHIKEYQDINPIDTINFPEELEKLKSGFLTQQGERISIKEFSEQFTQSVFCNYLVLKSEGFEDSTIKINVGSDGSLVTGEKNNKPMILQVPARIINLTLQKYILNLIGKTIELYNNGRLKYVVVESTKLNHRFYHKKSQIRERLMGTEEKE
ncbi:hypothetical protein A9200_00715 [Maribacter hydrothermalis]|uniref:Uncharacterized protein n=2 Tax=Maribacter hydrothermalis TaxID=1836467 RepID=A0A1B7ZEF4_9FLAO|nr:hypothetical protein A9200_00715 [Maribacter hydrothermalis]